MREDLLNEVSIDGINSFNNSAYMVSLLEEQKKKDKEKRKQEEIHSLSNQNLEKIFKINAETSFQQKEQIELLKEQNCCLRSQLELGHKNEVEAKKEAKHNRIWAYISNGIAFGSLIVTILTLILQ